MIIITLNVSCKVHTEYLHTDCTEYYIQITYTLYNSISKKMMKLLGLVVLCCVSLMYFYQYLMLKNISKSNINSSTLLKINNDPTLLPTNNNYTSLGPKSNNEKNNKYAVIIPSVRRENDMYLKGTLDSLEAAKPDNVQVILVNGNQPPEDHKYLEDWCISHHHQYKCAVPPKVSNSIIEEIIRDYNVTEDNLKDRKYYKWRTTETQHAMFGMQEYLKTGAEYMIWIQDDVRIENDLFSSLDLLSKEEEVVCLRAGNDYCGMVAYLFRRSFIQTILPVLEKEFKSKPIDWIIDDQRVKSGLQPRRIRKVFHQGKVSSNGAIRNVDRM